MANKGMSAADIEKLSGDEETIELTMAEAIKSLNSLSHLAQKSLPTLTSFRLGNVIDQLTNYYKSFEDKFKKRRLELQTPVREADGKIGERQEVQGDNLKKLETEQMELMAEKVKVKFRPTKLSDLGTEENIKNIEPQCFVGLRWLISE